MRAEGEGTNSAGPETMKSFFDTSVLVATSVEGHEHHERSFALFIDADRKTACCAAHSLAELYATLTRLPGKFRLSVDQAMLFLDSVEERLEVISLDPREYRLGDSGGRDCRYRGRNNLRRSIGAVRLEGPCNQDLHLGGW
jgi:hypothetical protein